MIALFSLSALLMVYAATCYRDFHTTNDADLKIILSGGAAVQISLIGMLVAMIP